MRVYHATEVPPRTTIHIDLVETMGLNCGAKKIAVCSNSDEVMFAWSEFPISISKDVGITHFEFPILKDGSPCNFQVSNIGDEEAVVNFLVEEFGGDADPLYFQR